MSASKKRFIKLCVLVKSYTTAISSVLLGLVALSLLLQVISRTLFSFSFAWVDESSRYLMIWVSLLMASVLIHDKDLISVDFLDKFWPPFLKKYRDILIRIVFFLLFAVMTIEGFSQAIYAYNETTIALGISWFWVYLSIPIGSLLMLLQMVFVAVVDFVGESADKV